MTIKATLCLNFLAQKLNFVHSVPNIPDPRFMYCEINRAADVSLLCEDKYTDIMAV